MFTKFMFGFAAFLLVAAVVVNVVLWNLNGYARAAIVEYGSQATRAQVGLDRLKLSLASGQGQGELDGFSVGNPQGFPAGKAIKIDVISLQVDPESVRGTGPIIIPEIVVKDPLIAYDLNNDGSSNLQTIQRNTQDYANSLAGNSGQPAKEPDGKQPRKIIIKDLLITGGHISISQASLGAQKLATDLPVIHLTDIGAASGGATAAQVAEQVLGKLSSAAIQSSLAELAKAKLNGALDAIPASAIGGAAIDSAGSALKGLLGH